MEFDRPPLVAGITGGIGSGKSSLARLLHGIAGWPCLEADRYGQEALHHAAGLTPRLRQRFGDAILDPAGDVIPARLARIVFAEEAALADLGAITHPWIVRRFTEEARALSAGGAADIILFDAALLLDWTALWPDGWTVRVIGVLTPLSLRLERLRRRGLTVEEARERARHQRSDEAIRAGADRVVENSGSWSVLVRNSVELARWLRSDRRGGSPKKDTNI